VIFADLAAASELLAVDGLSGWAGVKWGDPPPMGQPPVGGNGASRLHYSMPTPGFTEVAPDRTTFEYVDERMVSVLQVYSGESVAHRILVGLVVAYGAPQHSDSLVDVWRGEKVRLTLRR